MQGAPDDHWPGAATTSDDEEKKDLRASEQDRPAVKRHRSLFQRRAGQWGASRVVFVDEFGTNLGQTRTYAYAPQGQRAHGSAPVNTDPQLTLVMGMALDAVRAPLAFVGPMNSHTFHQYAEHVLGPALRPGDIVVADRLSAHQSPEAKRVIARRGAKLVLLPPYSPDLNPIEECGAKIKTSIRSRAPRTVERALDALGEAIGQVTETDTRGWFHHRASYLFSTSPVHQSHSTKASA